MRRPHLPILIGDCVSRHGQLHPGQTTLVYWASHRNLAWEENVVVVILYWLMRETRQISDISCLSRDECCSLEMLREINNKLLWYCSNPLITGGVTPATARKLGSSCWPSAKWVEKILNNERIKRFMRHLWWTEWWGMLVSGSLYFIV